MSYQVLVSDNAKSDLEGIADYICNSLYAPVAAQKILKKLQDSILGLSDFPERYPIYAEEPWQSRGVRKMNDGNYNIFYVVKKNTGHSLASILCRSRCSIFVERTADKL